MGVLLGATFMWALTDYRALTDPNRRFTIYWIAVVFAWWYFSDHPVAV